MHVVSEIQRRPNTARLPSEKYTSHFYSLCTLIQLVCVIIHVTQFDMASSRTFANSVWIENPFELAPSLAWVSKKCTHPVESQKVFAFKNVSLTMAHNIVGEMFVALAIDMHAAFFLAATALLVGAANRYAFSANFFEFRWRNINFRKDCISATEIILISALLNTIVLSEDPHRLLYEYLEACKVKSKGFLPYCSSVPLIVFVAIGFATYFVGFFVYLSNTLPQYGVMTEDEVVEYGEWLHRRRESRARERRLMEEMKKNNTRMQLMLENERKYQRVVSRSSRGMPSYRDVCSSSLSGKHVGGA